MLKYSTPLFVFIFAFCLSLTNCVCATEILPVKECGKIIILTPNGWTLRILKDGSGELSYGRMVQDTTHVKKGSFSFGEIYDSLTKVLKGSGDVLSSFTVSLEKIDKTMSGELYTNDNDLVKSFFVTAKKVIDQVGFSLRQTRH